MNERDILYVEDEDDFQLLVHRILTRAGFSVRLAGTGQEGWAALRAKRPDLLILDINLPDTDGYAICRQLREDPSYADLPILMLTVRRRPEEWLRGFSSGANDYISKPLNPPELLERVTDALQEKASRPKEGTPEYRLIQAAVAGNRSAFQVLIEQFRERLMSNVMPWTKDSIESEEVVSRAFVVAFDKIAAFRGESLFYTWLYRIAMNEITNIRRKSLGISLDALTRNDEISISALSVSDPDRLVHLQEQQAGERALELLRDVPQPFRGVMELFFLQDLSYEAIARHLEIPIGTVMSRLHKGKKLLQEAWAKKTSVPA